MVSSLLTFFVSRLLTNCSTQSVTSLVTNYNIWFITLNSTNFVSRLLTNFVNDSLTICNSLIIKGIPTLHILEVGH